MRIKINSSDKIDQSPTMVAVRSHEIKTFSLSKHLRDQYLKRDKLPPNPIDGRERNIVAVQLSLIETQKVTKPKSDLEWKDTEKKGDAKNEKETKLDASKSRQLEDLLRQEESALDYYESWHNVTTTISVAEILEQQGADSPIQRVLVIGPAGIGKTTLLHYMAHQWSLGNLWRERFQVLFWLPLRCLLKEDYKKSRSLSVATLLYQECLEPSAQKAVSAEALRNFLEQHKGQTLILLDGYDECAVEVEEEKSAIASVFQELLNAGTVVMTSRPYRLNPTLVKKFDRHLENRGFSNVQIKNYISDYFTETPTTAKSLIQLLAQQSRVQGMAHVPINLALLCGLHQEETQSLKYAKLDSEEMKTEDHSDSSLTQTSNLSNLYHQLTGYLVKRYLKERTGEDIRRVEDLTTLMDYCRDELNFLSRLAFLGLTQGEILLSPKLFQRLAQEYRVQPYLPDKTLHLGFLQKAGESDHRGETYTPHYFIHLSFQEFFAARYLSESLKYPKGHTRYQEAMQFLRTEKYEPRYAMVFRFVAGLTSQDKTQDKALLSFWKALLSQPLDMIGVGHMCVMIRCLDETGDDERVPHRIVLLKEIEGTFKQILEEGYETILEKSYVAKPKGKLVCAALKYHSCHFETAELILGKLCKKITIEPELTLKVLFTALKDEDYSVRNAVTKALLKFPRIAVLSCYLQQPMSLLTRANKDYAQTISVLLIKSSYLIYDNNRNQLILHDGQRHTYPITSPDLTKLVLTLVKAIHEQAKIFGLPLVLTESILKNKEAYRISDPADIPSILFDPLPLERRLSTIHAPLLRRLMKKEKVQMQAEAQQEEIHDNPYLREYYHSFNQYFDEAWKASGVIHSRLVAHGKKTKTDHVASGINMIGGAISVPGVSLITGLLEKAVTAYTYRDKQRAVNRIASFFTAHEAAQCIEMIARILTLVFAEYIENTGKPENATLKEKLKRTALKVKNTVMVGDVNTPIKQLAHNHVQLILKGIIEEKLKPYPKPENLSQFVEIVEAEAHSENLNLLPILTATDAGQELLERTTELATRPRSDAKSLDPSNTPATLLAASLTHTFGTSQQAKTTTSLTTTTTSSSHHTLSPDG